MDCEKFKDLLDRMRKFDEYMVEAHGLGIDLYESPIYENIMILFKDYIDAVFVENGSDWVYYYLYEYPCVKKENSATPVAWQDEEPVDMSSDEAFYEWLKGKGYIKEK